MLHKAVTTAHRGKQSACPLTICNLFHQAASQQSPHRRLAKPIYYPKHNWPFSSLNTYTYTEFVLGGSRCQGGLLQIFSFSTKMLLKWLSLTMTYRLQLLLLLKCSKSFRLNKWDFNCFYYSIIIVKSSIEKFQINKCLSFALLSQLQTFTHKYMQAHLNCWILTILQNAFTYIILEN